MRKPWHEAPEVDIKCCNTRSCTRTMRLNAGMRAFLVLALASSAAALVAPRTTVAMPKARRTPVTRVVPTASAKIIPVVYAGAGGSLVYHAATTAAAASPTYKALLVATGVLGIVDLGPTVNRQFAR